MLVVFFLILAFALQLTWGTLGNIFQVQVQSEPLIVLFAFRGYLFPKRQSQYSLFLLRMAYRFE